MRKTAVWIIIAVVLLICGAVIFVVAGSMVGWDLRMLGTGKYETNTYDIAEKFESITIDADISDVRFVPTQDGSCRVVCVENERIKHSVSVNDGTLVIECEDDRKWTDHISFFGFDGPSITVHLPGGKYSSLSVHTLAGDITLGDDFSFDSALIKCTTADVDFSADVKGLLEIRLTTGDIDVAGVSAGSIKLSATTGDIEGRSIDCAGQMSVYLDTGDISFENVRCESYVSEGTTGDTELEDVIASGHLSIETTTGDIELEHCDAATLYMKATTGDVQASLLSEKTFVASATTGDVRVPQGGSGGECEIKTTTGDINVTVK